MATNLSAEWAWRKCLAVLEYVPTLAVHRCFSHCAVALLRQRSLLKASNLTSRTRSFSSLSSLPKAHAGDDSMTLYGCIHNCAQNIRVIGNTANISPLRYLTVYRCVYSAPAGARRLCVGQVQPVIRRGAPSSARDFPATSSCPYWLSTFSPNWLFRVSTCTWCCSISGAL